MLESAYYLPPKLWIERMSPHSFFCLIYTWVPSLFVISRPASIAASNTPSYDRIGAFHTLPSWFSYIHTFVKSSSHNCFVNSPVTNGSIQHWIALPCTSLSRTECLILLQHDTPLRPLQFHGPILRGPAPGIFFGVDRNVSRLVAASGASVWLTLYVPPAIICDRSIWARRRPLSWTSPPHSSMVDPSGVGSPLAGGIWRWSSSSASIPVEFHVLIYMNEKRTKYNRRRESEF